MSGFDVRKAGGRIGAVVTGVDLGGDVPPAVAADLERALVAHKVLAFRDQEITDAHQLAFAGLFGPLTQRHPAMRTVADPQVLAVDGEDQRANHWHTDISFTVTPSLGTTLRSVVLPPYGGDTLVANGEAGYRALPAELREFAGRLTAVHTNRADQPRLGTVRGDEVRRAFMATRYEAAHPVVRVHPVSGEPCLFLGGFARRLAGMTTTESRPILDLLQAYVRRPEHVLRWTWHPGDVLIFDNRNTQHYAVNDYDDHKRVLHRVSITGDLPVGLDGKTSYAVSEEDW
ncbi:TauD/TfdA dioxygenase family protein [Mangrovihabitans endophyticus]|uniref:Taurine dioxygenase n=1 Tax=Mangrovihabitans endophyticus TaxID=1751298 RepID=A0A8J3BTU2_9ACTN|nr:TauD/TfdA family dioxygenase [Mangrovihabitans endophyticus]GGK73958.1 taurine dioxygenase [Mangrovihabitans endophyticus]